MINIVYRSGFFVVALTVSNDNSSVWNRISLIKIWKPSEAAVWALDFLRQFLYKISVRSFSLLRKYRYLFFSFQIVKFIADLGISKVQLKAEDIDMIMDTLIFDGKAERCEVGRTVAVVFASHLVTKNKFGLLLVLLRSCWLIFKNVYTQDMFQDAGSGSLYRAVSSPVSSPGAVMLTWLAQ